MFLFATNGKKLIPKQIRCVGLGNDKLANEIQPIIESNNFQAFLENNQVRLLIKTWKLKEKKSRAFGKSWIKIYTEISKYKERYYLQ